MTPPSPVRRRLATHSHEGLIASLILGIGTFQQLVFNFTWSWAEALGVALAAATGVWLLYRPRRRFIATEGEALILTDRVQTITLQAQEIESYSIESRTRHELVVHLRGAESPVRFPIHGFYNQRKIERLLKNLAH
ncbi:hypothetical protein [Verrucomicrobium sp. BvORR034]|uniref:hypothetical protein n=1 Tax=Verrucomicrobium sp. BvORR034 TaxID=1396418 RepID=UPI0006799488|nr:hypothetical protein [Verrucomicrobium sp. BvORR034]